jgi:hypothetical protein
MTVQITLTTEQYKTLLSKCPSAVLEEIGLRHPTAVAAVASNNTPSLTAGLGSLIANVSERYIKMLNERDASWQAHLSRNEAAEDRRAEIEAHNRAQRQRALMSVFGNNPVAKVLRMPAEGVY